MDLGLVGTRRQLGNSESVVPQEAGLLRHILSHAIEEEKRGACAIRGETKAQLLSDGWPDWTTCYDRITTHPCVQCAGYMMVHPEKPGVGTASVCSGQQPGSRCYCWLYELLGQARTRRNSGPRHLLRQASENDDESLLFSSLR